MESGRSRPSNTSRAPKNHSGPFRVNATDRIAGDAKNDRQTNFDARSEETKQIRHRWNLYLPGPLDRCPIPDGRQLVDIMKKILLATAAVLSFAAPSFAAEPAKTVGQAPPATSFYLAQDTATMKCQVVSALPATGGNTKVIGMAHRTQASAETALTADKTCTK
jgi:hypothetical protein